MMSTQKTQTKQRFVDQNNRELDLTLYKYDACPFCARVTMYLRRKGWDVPVADTLKDPTKRQRLLEIGGKTQVPCLVIDGRPLYESRDIIDFLENKVRLAS